MAHRTVEVGFIWRYYCLVLENKTSIPLFFFFFFFFFALAESFFAGGSGITRNSDNFEWDTEGREFSGEALSADNSGDSLLREMGAS